MSNKQSLDAQAIKNWFDLFSPLFLVVILCFAYLGQKRVEVDLERKILEGRTVVQLGVASIANDLSDALRHLSSLTREKPLIEAIDAPSPSNLARMADNFISLVQRNPNYVKVRWIDAAGMERLRIDRIDGNAVVVANQELQLEANRYYFLDVIKMKPGEIYISRADTETERGTPKAVARRVFRMATPIFDSANRPRGIVIIDLLVNSLLNGVAFNREIVLPSIIVLNNDGVWLNSFSSSSEAALTMPGNASDFSQGFPDAWQRMVKSEEGNFVGEDGLWIWQKTLPVVAKSGVAVVAQEPPWLLVSHLPEKDLWAIRLNAWRQHLPIFLMALVVLAAISWLNVSRKNLKNEPFSATVINKATAKSQWGAYGLAVMLPLAVLLLRLNLPSTFGEGPLLLLLVFPITISALLGGIGPGILSTVIAALASTYLLLQPYRSFRIEGAYDLFQWTLLIGNGILISVLSQGLRDARRLAELRQKQQSEVSDKLVDSEARFRQLAEYTQDIFWIREWPEESISYVSPAFETITGISLEKVYQDSQVWFRIVHPDDRYQARRDFLEQINSGGFSLEYRIIHSDGSIRWAEDIGTSIRDHDGRIFRVIGIVRDITKRKLIEEQLQNSELTMRLAQDAAKAGSWEWILASNSNSWSESLWALYGLDSNRWQASYEAWIESIYPEDREATVQKLYDAVNRGEEVELQWRVNLPPGQPERWLMARGRSVERADGRVERYVGIAIDITERKQMEAELGRYRHHLEELVEERTRELALACRSLELRSEEVADLYNNAPCGYHSLNAEGLIVAINDTELDWLGYQREEVLSRLNFKQIITSEGLAVFAKNFPKFKETGVINNLEIDLVRKDGSVLPVLINATSVRDENGNFLFSRSTLFDNTERKMRETQIAQLNAELSRRVEEAETATKAKSVFLANMTHEIRTPMNAVLGFCYRLEQRNLDPESLTLARKIHRAGQALLSLINDVLDFSKIEAGRLEIEKAPFKLTELLENIASIMVASARHKDLEMIIIPPVLVEELVGDAQRLQQVLINLISNAIKFTSKGEVELRITVESSDERQVNLRFGVRDTGIGISSEQQNTIFSAFSQADGSINRRFGGTGLGLSISKQLVEMMGGRLQVKSEVGRGSEFWFVLPLLRDQNPHHQPAQLSRLELLIADDCATARDALSAVTGSLGWRADVIDSGEAAVMQALTRTNGKHFYDALLFDWKMPGLNGLDAACAIRQALKQKKLASDFPIILMVTGASRDELLAQPGIDCADEVLSKPITPSTLYTAIANSIKQRQQALFPVENPQISDDSSHRINGVRILVVDDSEINQEVAKRILEANGAVVHLACDGQQAVEWLEANPDAIDIILMDVQMPRLDGYAATRQIRAVERWQRLPIVALTAGAFQELRDAAEASGMNDFIAKPFNVEQMLEIIHRWTTKENDFASRELAFSQSPIDTGSQPTTGDQSDLPSLFDINLPEALEVWGQLEIYRTYLDKFVDDYADVGLIIEDACRQGNLQSASSLVHKLSGLAGTLRLPIVSKSAQELEMQLKAGEPALELVKQLQIAIDKVCTTIRGWKQSRDSSSEPEKTPYCPEVLVAAFAGLLNALETNDPDESESYMKQLRKQLDSSQLIELDRLLTEFDFRGAEALARNLLRSLNLSIPE